MLLDEAFVEPFRESWFELESVRVVDEVDWLATLRRDSPPWVLMVSDKLRHCRPFFFSGVWESGLANESLQPSRVVPPLGDSE